MRVEELIDKLKTMPPKARVFHLWDGEPRTEINVVYESKNGHVITSDFNQTCYSTEARQKNAPTSDEQFIWVTDQGECESDPWNF